MRHVLWIPCDGSVHTVDIDGLEGDGDNPYYVATELLQTNAVEKVRTPIKNFYMFVDEMGNLTGLPVNPYASFRLYPAFIKGHAVLIRVDEVMTPEGPDLLVKHMESSTVQKLTKFLEE